MWKEQSYEDKIYQVLSEEKKLFERAKDNKLQLFDLELEMDQSKFKPRQNESSVPAWTKVVSPVQTEEKITTII